VDRTYLELGEPGKSLFITLLFKVPVFSVSGSPSDLVEKRLSSSWLRFVLLLLTDAESLWSDFMQLALVDRKAGCSPGTFLNKEML
jgi:hypothetical protein